jgi:hypothetical protein
MKQNLTFFSKSPVKDPPPLHGPQWGPYGKRCSVYRANELFTHSYLTETPVKKLSQEPGGKHLVSVHGAPRGRKDFIQWGAAWFHKGMFYDTAVTSASLCSLQHDAFHLGLGKPQPR